MWDSAACRNCSIPTIQRDDSVLAKRVVGITVQPALAGLGRGDDRMCASVRVFAGVTIRRAITAQCNTALLTRAQMDPRGADFHTLGALANFGLFDRTNRVEMRTSSVGHRFYSRTSSNGPS